METLRVDIDGLGVGLMYKKPLFPRDTGFNDNTEIKVSDEGWIDGGKELGVGKWVLHEELQKQTDIFYRESEKCSEVCERVGIEFPRSSFGGIPEAVFGDTIRFMNKLDKKVDFGKILFSGHPVELERLRLFEKKVSVERSRAKLRMVEQVNEGNPTGVGKADGGKEGLVHGGIEFTDITSLGFFNLMNRDNSLVNVGSLPQFVEKNCLRNIKKISK